MTNIKKILNRLPGWVITLLVFGFLYISGLHIQVIGQMQRLILATGLMNPDIPAVIPKKTAEASGEGALNTANAAMGYDFAMTTPDGKTVTMESLKGKVIFLNQWATWCPPCRAEMPAIERLYQTMNKDEVAFVMLSLDETPAKAEGYVKQEAFSFPVYFPASPFPQDFISPAIPTTLILDTRGVIVQRIEGMANYDTAEFRHFLKSLYQ